MPTVSIIIPTHNRAELLGETLESVRNQTFSDWEAIVIDDHSTEDIVAVVSAQPDSRFRTIPLKDKSGAPAARNHGVTESRGEFVIFLDSDDLLAPHCLSQRIEMMRANPDLDFVIFPCQLFRKLPGDIELLWNRKTDEDDLDRFLKMDVPWQTTSPIWRKSSFSQFKPWDESVLSGQDWEFHIRAIVAGMKYEWLDAFTPSPGTPGEGRGEGSFTSNAKDPHPSPLPEYRARGRTQASPDCFWRRADADRDSIGKQSFSAKHARARQEIIAKMQNVIEAANLMTPARIEMFAGMYFQAAERTAQFLFARMRGSYGKRPIEKA